MTALTKLALAIPLAVAVSACGGFNKTPEERALSRAESLLDDVKADEGQRVKVRAIVTDLTKTFADERVARGTTKGAFIAQLEAEKADIAVVTAEADKATASFTKNAHAVVDAGLRIHATLTPEQRAILTAKATPGRGMKTAFFVAGRMGYGPPANAEEARARAAERLEDRLDDIKATDEQKAALRPIAAGLLEEALPLLDERDVIVAAFTGAWKSERPDAVALHALVDDESVKVNALARTAAESFVQAHAILTPEQRTALGVKLAEGGGCSGHDDE